MFGMRRKLQRLECTVRSLETELNLVRQAAGMKQAGEHANAGRDTPACNGPEGDEAYAGRRFNAAGFPMLGRNERIDFSLPANAAFLGTGWWDPESWGRWGRETSELRFCVSESYSGGYLDVLVTVQSIASDAAARPSLKMLANGFFLGDFTLSGMRQTIRLRLPPAAIEDGNILLVMQHSHPAKPASVGDSLDDRTLGAGLIALLLP